MILLEVIVAAVYLAVWLLGVFGYLSDRTALTLCLTITGGIVIFILAVRVWWALIPALASIALFTSVLWKIPKDTDEQSAL